MSRKLTVFEYDRVIGSIRQEVERTVRDFLCEAVWLTVDTPQLSPKEVLLTLLVPPAGRPFPFLNRVNLFTAPSDDSNETAVNLALYGLTDRAKRAFLHNAICNHMDYIACLSFFELLPKQLTSAEQSASALLCQPLSTLQGTAADCRAKGRNVYSHDKKSNQLDCTEDDCRELISRAESRISSSSRHIFC